MTRHAGLLLPLFSAWTTSSWGIGECGDVGPLSAWLAEAGFDRLMLLPIGTMADGQASPYSARSAMAIDPIFISIEAMEDFAPAGGIEALSGRARDLLADARASDRVKHASVGDAKAEALDLAFARFVRYEWERLTLRGSALAAYMMRERWWLDDYALFEAISEHEGGVSWREWPAPLRDRDPRALEEARRHLARQVLSHQYRQWIAETQWQAARTAALQHGVRVTGDLPFVVNTHSADVWARQDEFLLDVSAGAPPDAFSATGQDWGLPTYRWDVIRAKGYPWIRMRAARMAALYDEFRVDHLIGFFRTYGRPPGGEPFFNPPDEPTQVEQGEAVLRVFQASGARVIAEDLGVIPDFARASLQHVGVPGFKVLRWERAWNLPGQPFIDPADYPAASVAMTGTHDTETLAGWWDHATRDERVALTNNAFFASRGLADPDGPWQPALRDALLTLVYASGSDDLFMPVQDVFGWRDRINVPATVNDINWTWRLPWPADRLADQPEPSERAAFCRALAEATGRSPRSARPSRRPTTR